MKHTNVTATEVTPNLRDKILDAARHILADKGYDGLSMRRIAQVVGCKAPSIYHHFENKDRIVHTLIDEGFQRQNEAMEAAASQHDNPLKRIEARSRAYVSFGLNNPEYYRIMYILRTDQMARFPKENYRRARSATERTAEDLKKANEMGFIALDDPVEVLAMSGAAMLHGAITLILSNRLDVRMDRTQFLEYIIQKANPRQISE